MPTSTLVAWTKPPIELLLEEVAAPPVPVDEVEATLSSTTLPPHAEATRTGTEAARRRAWARRTARASPRSARR